MSAEVMSPSPPVGENALSPMKTHDTGTSGRQLISNDVDMSNDSNNSSVQVAVRIRPLFDHEKDRQGYLQLHGQNNLVDTGFVQPPLIKSLSTQSNSTATTYLQRSSSDQSENILSYQTIEIGSEESRNYTFDHVFPNTSEQAAIYYKCVTPLVQSCLEGYNATVLAYGQTGSGKTHTILGDLSGRGVGVPGISENEIDIPETPNFGMQKEAGMIPRALCSIFDGLEHKKSYHAEEVANMDYHGRGSSPTRRRSLSSPQSSSQSPFEYSVSIQFVELYGEEIRDLLNTQDSTSTRGRPGGLRRHQSTSSIMADPRNMKSSIVTIKDGKAGEGAELLGAEKIEVKSVQSALDHLKAGIGKRVVGRTAMNAHSSRSHAIFTVVIHQTTRRPVMKGFGGDSPGNEKVSVEMKTSKIHFVDLCGSERAKRAETVGKRLKEGIDINKGLLVLGNVISALGRTNGSKAQHVPYRDSKLTRILRGSLGGNHKTLMIACISKSPSNEHETNSTLRYANRAKNIQNHAKINVDPQHLVVQQLRSRVAALAAEVLRIRNRDDGDDKDNEENEDNPFSISFLQELVRGSDPPGRGLKKSNSLNSHPHPKSKRYNRPSTSPNLSDKKEKISFLRNVSWHDMPLNENSEHGDKSVSGSVEDPELTKNIESYDFALAALRQSIDKKAQGESFFEAVQEWDGSDDEDNESMQRLRSPSSPLAELKKIRNIDELYDYLNEHTYVNDDGDIVDDEGTVISGVVTNHVIQLDDVISQNEVLLRNMKEGHEIFAGARSENDQSLAVIETELQQSRKEKNGLEKFKEEFAGDPQDSKGLLKALAVKDEKIAELLKDKDDLVKLNEESDTNLKTIQDLENSIIKMKKQRSDLTQITSRSRNRGRDAPSVPLLEKLSSSDDNDSSSRIYSDHVPITPESLHKVRVEVKEKDQMTGFDLIIDESYNRAGTHGTGDKSSSDLRAEPRRRTGTDETKSSNDVRGVSRRLKSSQVPFSNTYRKFSNDSIPRLLDTSMDTSRHSKVSLLETPGFKSTRLTSPKSKSYSYKRGLSTSEIKKRIQKRENMLGTRYDPVDYGQKRERFLLAEKIASNYRQQFSKEEDTTWTSSAPKSVFDVVEESMAASRTAPIESLNMNYDSEKEEVPVFCGAESFVSLFRDFFGWKNPVVRQWDA